MCELKRKVRYFFYAHLPACLYPLVLTCWYYKFTKRKLDLHNPQTFNDKIQWSKLYDSTPIKTRLADKYAVREWVKEKIGEEYLIPLLGVYDRFEDINFNTLPDRFVIKCNHGSGYNIIVKDKKQLDLKRTQKQLNQWMHENFAFKGGFELHYLPIKPKIIIEKYMEDETGELRDYKFFCFNGKPEFVWVDSQRYVHHKRNLYDLNWNLLPFKFNVFDNFPSIPKPACLPQLIDLAGVLSTDFNMVRVDFYVIDNHIFFGEFTFTSGSGLEYIAPDSFENHLSTLYKLPKQAYNIKTGKYYDFPFQTKGK